MWKKEATYWRLRTEEKDREQMRTRPENVNADGPTSGETEVFQAQAYLI